MTENEISRIIVDVAYKIHIKLGPGLLESIYEKCFKYELEKNGYDVKQQVIVNLEYDDLVFDSNLKVDLLVNDCIVIELKSVDRLLPIHEAQLLAYMKILKKPQGLLINFNTINITSELIPLVNDFFKKLDEE